MNINRLKSGFKNRIKLKNTNISYLIEQALIFLFEILFKLFIYLNIKFILVFFPHSRFIIKVKENNKFWHNINLRHWETHGFNALNQLVNKDDIVLDVGAWNGVYTLYFSKLVGKNGKIYSFEPDPKAMRLLKTNILLNKIKNVKLEKSAVSNTDGKEVFHIMGVGGTSGSYLEKTLEINRSEITGKKLLIDTITLDNYCKKHNIIPNGIKIDVEGAEAFVFQGLKKITNEYKPWILLEFHGRFMSDEERISNWKLITKDAKKIIFIGGITKFKYQFGELITHKTEITKDDNAVIHVLILY